jgi:hypothetical protein
MPNPDIQAADLHTEAKLRVAALERLRHGTNPFAGQVTAVGTAYESIQAGFPEFTANQLSDLLDIIGTYREGRPATRVYPLLGERGAGKTHLLYSMRAELQQQALQSGDETMLVVVDRLSAGMDPIDYLLWQIVNYLLAQKGDGERMLGVIAGRLTGRLLAEALRRLGPQQRADLIPPKGFWDRIRFRMGSAARVKARLNGVEDVIRICDKRNPSPEELRDACQVARLPPAVAVQAIDQHLELSESKDVLGWFRKQLYSRLGTLALLGEREPFEELHSGDYEEAPANVKNAGNLSRRLLETWIELLTALKMPVVVTFDQLEDYLRSPDPQQEIANRRYFTGSLALFINELRHVCILIFVETTLWTDLVNRADAFESERLTQPFALPGRPAKPYITMPDEVAPDVLTRLIQQRVRMGFPELDCTGLAPTFPFDESDLQDLNAEMSLRACLRRLAKRYDEIVYPTAQPKVLRQKLTEIWEENFAAAQKTYGSEMNFKVAFIPEVQNALQGWLLCLEQYGLTGCRPWDKVEMLTDRKKQQYGNLNVIRTAGPHAPGIGIAAWLGKMRAQPFDLKQRVGFFDMKPCPIRTLIMLRADGDQAVSGGESKAVYDKAIRAGHDLRIQKYEPKHLHALMAFLSWHQAAMPELESAKETDPDAEKTFRVFLAALSNELLGWIDTWRQPLGFAGGTRS